MYDATDYWAIWKCYNAWFYDQLLCDRTSARLLKTIWWYGEWRYIEYGNYISESQSSYLSEIEVKCGFEICRLIQALSISVAKKFNRLVTHSYWFNIIPFRFHSSLRCLSIKSNILIFLVWKQCIPSTSTRTANNGLHYYEEPCERSESARTPCAWAAGFGFNLHSPVILWHTNEFVRGNNGQP